MNPFQVGDKVRLRFDVLQRHARSVPAHAGYTVYETAWRETLKVLLDQVGEIERIFPNSDHVNVQFESVTSIGINYTELVPLKLPYPPPSDQHDEILLMIDNTSQTWEDAVKLAGNWKKLKYYIKRKARLALLKAGDREQAECLTNALHELNRAFRESDSIVEIERAKVRENLYWLAVDEYYSRKKYEQAMK